MRLRVRHVLSIVAVAGISLAACGDDAKTAATNADRTCFAQPSTPAIGADAVARADTSGTTITLVTHDSFAVSNGVLDDFTKATGIKVDVLQQGDAGQLVSQAVLTAGKPVGDVLYGIDNTFLCRGLSAGVFQPYASPALADVPANLRLDPQHRVTPVDVGDVCVNYATAAFSTTAAPASLDDLTKPDAKGRFVTENPETSSPGFAFLLATIAKYGDGWQDYWRKLRANDVQVASGWNEAYTEVFAGGKGKRPIVTSYATSPVAEVVYADPKIDRPPTAVMTDGCFRQIEFAGVLRGTQHPEAAAKLVDFLLSKRFQEDMPLNMFVFPANTTAAVPEEFTKFATKVTDPGTLDPATIEANRARWTDQWTKIVLR